MKSLRGLLYAAVAVSVFAPSSAVLAEGHHGGNRLPIPIIRNSIQITAYDGVTDDLLSGGLNQDGLEGAPPAVSSPPTAAELRRLAIYGNYRGVVDPVPGGGIGVFWGPLSQGHPVFPAPVVEGLIPGVEYKALARTNMIGIGQHDVSANVNNITVVVQIPENFDPVKRCIVSAPPSGSRGVYGGIAVGEWGLFHGCAVVMGGKGTGTGFEDLDTKTVYDMDGNAVDARAAGRKSQFTVRNNGLLKRFKKTHPYRVATKHAHSQVNPEARWGDFALLSIEFAFWALNDHFGVKDYNKDTTIVIASGVSNGAGTSVHSVERDTKGLIDGLVVTEPSMNPRSAGMFEIDFGGDVFTDHGATLADDITYMSLYAACAATNSSLAGMPFYLPDPSGAPAGSAANRCAQLAAMGLITGADQEAQSADAIQKLRAIGYYSQEDWGIPFHENLNLWRSLNPTYVGSYGKFAVWEDVCDVSFAATDGAYAPTPASDAILSTLFATSSGIPATAGINLIADNSVGGPILENQATSPSTGAQDINLDGALCFRYMSTGDGSLLGGHPTKTERRSARRFRKGAREVQTTGNLRGVPAIIGYGREDALVFPNSQSRAYYGLNQLTESAGSQLRIWEVTPGQHFDTFLSNYLLIGDEPAFVPLHFYLTEGLEMMLEHLQNGTPLPPSQVIRSQPYTFATPYEASDAGGRLTLPAQTPVPGDTITFTTGTPNVLYIPN